MKALLLGGAGFIGLHLARRLVADGHEVTIVDDFSRGRDDPDLDALREHPSSTSISGDLTDPATYADLPHGWDQIYLLAAVVGVRNVESRPGPGGAGQHAGRAAPAGLDRARASGCSSPPPARSTRAASTPGIVAGADRRGRPGDDRRRRPRPGSRTPISKLLGEAAVPAHRPRRKGFPAVVGRFHNVYGPRMGADHVIPEMLAARDARRGPVPRVRRRPVPGVLPRRRRGRGDAAADGQPEAAGEIVHIGNDTRRDEHRRPGQAGAAGRRRRPGAGQPRPAPAGSVARRCPDLPKLRELTGYEPTVSLEEGVRRTFEWYRESCAAPGQDQTGGDPRP